ncbi:hypothetical protein JKP88DRAFT_242826 [Tribonema minus]|uniref:Thioredoxin domain-containing protein n=1 Tax=Tribonema minus TaxID=303371 RepID=A0A836CNM6_9STRA|nr:hypothetical protein JKP88DRAFT_242826 [Tribonema minus]
MRSIVKAGALMLWATAGALGGIVKLNQTTFAEGIANLQQSHDTVLVVFHRPSCGACKRLAPALEVMARDAEQYKLAIVKVESTTNPDLAREFGVKHLPTVKFAHHGGDWTDFPGRANLDSLREFARRMVAPAVAVWEGVEDLSRAAAAEQGGGAEGGRIVFVLIEGERGAAGAPGLIAATSSAADTCADLIMNHAAVSVVCMLLRGMQRQSDRRVLHSTDMMPRAYMTRAVCEMRQSTAALPQCNRYQRSSRAAITSDAAARTQLARIRLRAARAASDATASLLTHLLHSACSRSPDINIDISSNAHRHHVRAACRRHGTARRGRAAAAAARGFPGAAAADGAPPLPPLREVFQAAARQLRHVALFAAPGAGRGAAAVESHIASLVKGGAKAPYVVRYSPSEGLAAAFAQGDGGSGGSGGSNGGGGGGAEPQLEALKDWVLSNNHPFMSHLESYDQYWQLKAVRHKFLAIVMAVRDKIFAIVTVDGKAPEHAAFAEQAERVVRDGGAALHARVAFCVMDPRVFRDELPADRAYWDRPDAQTAEAMAQFIGDVLSGEAPRRTYGQSEYLAFFYRKWRGKLAAAYPASLLLLLPLLLILYVLLFDKEKPKGA